MKSFWNEEWREVEPLDDGMAHRMRYAVSNYGRVASYTDAIENGRPLRLAFVNGYPTLSIGRPLKVSRCVHKLVAHYFLPQPQPDERYVIHVDYDKSNNMVANLRWASKAEMLTHQNGNPQVLHARANHTPRKRGAKLTAKQVRNIKALLAKEDRKRTYKQIARSYGISEMQLYRIKSGANWAHVTA